MKQIALVALLAAGCVARKSAQGPPPPLRHSGTLTGTYDISRHGQLLGTESISVDGDTWISRVVLSPAQIEFMAETQINLEGEPGRYRLEGKPARRDATVTIEVDRPGHAFIEQTQSDQRTNIAVTWEGPSAILDNNVIAHWAILGRRWQERPLKLSAIVPQDASVAELELEAGADAPEGTVALRAMLRGVEARLILDQARTLQVLTIPSIGLRAVRRGAEARLVQPMTRGTAKVALEPEPPAAGSEHERSFKSGDLWIYGTLTLPERGGRAPIAIFVHGSGPLDRDETVGGVKVFRDLSRALAAQGIASLRFDKVTHTYRNPPGRSIAKMTLEDEAIVDVRAAIEWVRKQPDIDGSRIAIISHGPGASVAGAVANNAHVRAVVLLAAPALPPDRALIRQYAFRAERDGRAKPALQQEMTNIQREFDRIRTGAAPTNELIEGAPAGYWRDWLQRDPVQLVRGIQAPVLLVQGGRDWQTLSPEAQTLLEARKEAGAVTELVLVPDANHLLVRVQDQSDGSEYGSKSSVAPAARSAIAEFLKKQLLPAS